jgi:spore germination protein KC
MKARVCLILWAGASLLLTGCWSKLELTERAFVLAIAIDKGEKNNLELTSQIYKPASQFGSPSGQSNQAAFVNVTLDGSNVSNIIRNTKSISGRHSQFSHIQIILISEEIARERLSEMLDFFYRNPEIHLGTSVMIATGKARDYLNGNALIENTLGSQLSKQLDFSAGLAGRTVLSTFLDLAFQLKSESGSAMLPIVMIDRQHKQKIVHGIALARPDRMVGKIGPDKAAYLLLLAGEYQSGSLEIPCGGDSRQTETVEILRARSKVTPVLEGDDVSARIKVNIEASTSELVCTTIRDMKDEKRYEERMEQYIKKKMASVLNTLRKSKADVLGIGHKLYLRHPSRWKKIKPEWPERFAGMPIELSVDVHLLNSRMMSPEPFVRVGED